jgi:hypothetical protein
MSPLFPCFCVEGTHIIGVWLASWEGEAVLEVEESSVRAVQPEILTALWDRLLREYLARLRDRSDQPAVRAGGRQRPEDGLRPVPANCCLLP